MAWRRGVRASDRSELVRPAADPEDVHPFGLAVPSFSARESASTVVDGQALADGTSGVVVGSGSGLSLARKTTGDMAAGGCG